MLGNPCLVVKPLAAGDYDVVEIAFDAECRAFGLGLETVALQHFAERDVTYLIAESGDFHLLTGHPIARRASLKVALTSSGGGHSVGFASRGNSSSLGAFGFCGGSSGVKPSLV